METKTNIANNIKKFRIELGLTQTRLGELTGHTRNQIASYENGSAEPNICGLLRLAYEFEVSLNKLVL